MARSYLCSAAIIFGMGFWGLASGYIDIAGSAGEISRVHDPVFYGFLEGVMFWAGIMMYRLYLKDRTLLKAQDKLLKGL